MKVLSLANQPRGVRLRSVASYLPARVVTNDDLAAMGAALTPEEIVRLSGIMERHWVAADEATSAKAARRSTSRRLIRFMRARVRRTSRS